MFKRIFWLLMGMGVGFGSSLWVQRRLREAVARYAPERLSADVSDAIRTLGGDFREAMVEGRHAMRERERELRSGTGPR